MTMLRISGENHDEIIYLQSSELIERVLRSNEPGRYQIDEMSTKPLPSGHTVRRWGIGIKKSDGSVVIEADPRES
jgi:hypothetical protein